MKSITLIEVTNGFLITTTNKEEVKEYVAKDLDETTNIVTGHFQEDD